MVRYRPLLAALVSGLLFFANIVARADEALYNSRFPAFYDEAANQLYWYHSLKGDCDQNGVVNISDLSRLGVHLGATVGPNQLDEAVAAADCDGNGEVSISDLSAMGANLNKQVVRYRIWVRPDFAPDYPFDTDTVVPGYDAYQNFGDSTGDPLTQRLRYSIDTTGFEYHWLWVQEELPASVPGRLSKLKMASNTPNTSIQTYDPNWGLGWDGNMSTLSFFHTMRGDFDQNGAVNLGDLNPLGANMGEVGPWAVHNQEWVIDSNRDSSLTTTDWVVPWSLFINQTLDGLGAGYNAYYAPSGADTPPTHGPDGGILAAQFTIANSSIQNLRRSYSVLLSGAKAMPGNLLWVRPVASNGELGARSEVVTIP